MPLNMNDRNIWMDITTAGTHAGSSVVGALVAWFTLKNKVDRLEDSHQNFALIMKGEVDRLEASHGRLSLSIEKAIVEIKESMKETVSKEKCGMCEINNDNQFKAIDDKLELLIANSLNRRKGD